MSTSIAALVTAHRFIDFFTFEVFQKKSEKIQLAAICFLSCKLDEHSRSLRDVVSVVKEVYRQEDTSAGSKPDMYDEEVQYPAIREAVISAEQVLLRATGFDTSVDIAHKYLFNMARSLCLSCPTVQYAIALLNDCYLDAKCLSLSPVALAACCLQLGIHTVGISSSESFHETDTKEETISIVIKEALPETVSTARVCLKSPNHHFHKILKTSWWSIHFGIDPDAFWEALEFVSTSYS